MEKINLEQALERIKELEKSNSYLTTQVYKYQNGDDSLYHAVKRKMSEFSILLNKTEIEVLNLDDKNDKTFDRVVSILEKCEKIAISASALGQRTGIEKKEEEKTPFVDSIAESRK